MLFPEQKVIITWRKNVWLIFWSVSIALTLSACQGRTPPPSSVQIEPTQNILDATNGFEAAHPASPTPTPASKPAFILRVPPRWAEAGADAVEHLNAAESDWIWQLDVGQPSITDLEAGWADAVLIEGQEGISVGQRPIALAVPFISIWEDLTLEQAETILNEGSEFIQVTDWSEMQPTLKSILVEGYHPSDPDYPLQESWSLHASQSAEPAIDTLARALKERIERDAYLELATVGDLMLARSVGTALESGDLNYPFERVNSALQEADITVGNLESALGVSGIPENKGYTFRAPPQAAAALGQAGFDLLSLANNHAMDFGPQLLIEAISTLEGQGIRVAGAGENAATANQPVIFDQNGLSVAFLSFVDVPQEFRGFDTRSWQATETRPGVAWADVDRMRAEIERADANASLVVVLLHSGYEYVPKPSPPQINAARSAVEAGADLVLGHHAHLLQPIEFHPLGVIIYGLGNFVFEDAGPPETALARVWLDEGGVRELNFIPMQIDDAGVPTPVSGSTARSIIATLNSYTEAWKAQTPVLEP